MNLNPKVKIFACDEYFPIALVLQIIQTLKFMLILLSSDIIMLIMLNSDIIMLIMQVILIMIVNDNFIIYASYSYYTYNQFPCFI